MKKIHFLVTLAAVAAILSSCGDDRAANNISGQDDVQNETSIETEKETENQTEKQKTIHKFDMEKDVMLIYEYDENGDLFQVHLREDPEAPGFYVSETVYDEDGYLASIKVKWEGRRPNPAPGKTNYIDDVVEDAMIAEYNANGQITYFRYNVPYNAKEMILTYKITYDSDNGHSFVGSTVEEMDDLVVLMREYDSNFNMVFTYWDFWVPGMSEYIRHYTEYEYDEDGNVGAHSYQERFDAQGIKIED